MRGAPRTTFPLLSFGGWLDEPLPPVTGTVAVTLDNLTGVAAGEHSTAGTLAVTLGTLTSAADGTSAQTGTLAETFDNLTSTAAGTSAQTGTLAVTLENLTSGASGTFVELVTGTLAVTLAATTSTATGTSAQTGTLAETLDNITSSAAGASGVSGTLAETLEDVTSTASGTYTPAGVTGDLAETLENVTSTAAGTFTPAAVTGTLAATLDNLTSVAAGSSTVGDLAETLDTLTSAATGAFADAAVGTVAATLGNLTSVASGTFTQTGPTIVNAQATGVGAPTAGTTGVTVTKPTGLADGDVMYAFVSRTDFSNTAEWTCSGWTRIGPTAANQGSTTGNDVQTTILRKVVTSAAGEPSNYTFVCAFGLTIQSIGIIVALRGVDTGTPEDITVPAYGFTQNSINPPTLNATSSTDNAFVIAYMQQSLAAATSGALSAPSGYTLISGGNTFAIAGGVFDNKAGTASKLLGAAGSTTGTNVWTNASDPGTAESLTAVVLVRAGVAVDVTGALAKTLDNTTSAAAGTSAQTGALAETLNNLTAVAVGASGAAAELAETLAELTSTASGTFTTGTATGTLAVTLENLTAVTEGSSVTGTLDETLDNLTSVATGTVEGPPTGTVDEPLADLTSTAEGTVTGAVIGPDPSPLKCNIRHYRFTRPLRYRRAAERPAVDAWARSYSNDLIDFSDPTYTFTFRVGPVGGVSVLEKATNILGAAGSGGLDGGAPNLSIRWEPGDLDLEPGIYDCQVIARNADLDTVFHGTLKISDPIH